MMMSAQELRDFLEFKSAQYNRPEFIENDPVSVPHQFERKEDIEIAGLLAATLAWGRRAQIILKATLLMKMMDHTPHDFILHAGDKDLQKFHSFIHRTFNGEDCIFFLKALQGIYRNCGTLEEAFFPRGREIDIRQAISNFRNAMLLGSYPARSAKHLADPMRNAAAKRINMFLRWMVRRDKNGVDFGLWQRVSPSGLMIPLDVHTANTSRMLGLLTRRSNDWTAVEELTAKLRQFDPDDPVKYDYALFNLGIEEHFA